MNRFLGSALVGLLPFASFAATAVEPPNWAYMSASPGTDVRLVDPTVYTRPGSDLTATQAAIQDRFMPPDWYPNEHPALPEVVEFGSPPLAQACMRCHLPNGGGHPESAYVAGLPVNYIIQQMRDFRSGARVGLGEGRAARSFNMVEIASAVTDEEIAAAAEYFASLPPIKWTEVIETDMVPETYIPAGVVMRFVMPDGGMEPIGQRIVEVPVDTLGANLRDSHISFIAYVPVGSIAKGQELASTGGGKTIQCTICHGPNLRGLGDVPGIAGRSPAYMVRQLVDIKHGVRAGSSAALMQAVVANLSEEDMVNIVAYVASLDP